MRQNIRAKTLNKSLLVLATLFLFSSLSAATTKSAYPDNTLLVLKGEMGSVRKRDCFLYVTDFGYKGPEQKDNQFFAEVLTSFSHSGDSPDPIEVSVTPNRTDTLSGKGSNGKDEIVIFLDPKTLDLYNAKSFNLKWWHRNHFDTFRCTNLKVHEDFTIEE